MMIVRPMDFMESKKLKSQQAGWIFLDKGSGNAMLGRHRPWTEGRPGHWCHLCHCCHPVTPPGSMTIVMPYAVYLSGHAGVRPDIHLVTSYVQTTSGKETESTR